MGFFMSSPDPRLGYFGSADLSGLNEPDLLQPMPFGVPLTAFRQASAWNTAAPPFALPHSVPGSLPDHADSSDDERLAQAPPATNDNRTPEETCAKANQDCRFRGAMQTPSGSDAYRQWMEWCQGNYENCTNLAIGAVPVPRGGSPGELP